MNYDVMENRTIISGKKFKYYEGVSKLGDSEPQIILSTTDKQEAIDALEGFRTTIYKETGNQSSYEVTEYYVEENEYNEDGDWVSGGNICKYAEVEEE